VVIWYYRRGFLKFDSKIGQKKQPNLEVNANAMMEPWRIEANTASGRVSALEKRRRALEC